MDPLETYSLNVGAASRFAMGGISGGISDAYEAIDNNRGPIKRKQTRVILASEDYTADQRQREKLTSSIRDLVRNYSLACWAVRKHLDYVTSFKLQAKTGKAAFDDEIEAFMADYAKPQNCDAAGRHPLRRIIRNAEARRIVDGDLGLEKVLGSATIFRVRGTLNLIEGDRICNADEKRNGNKANWVNGVQLDKYGRAQSYSICKREGRQRVWEKDIPARNFYLHAYWDTSQRFDMVRGLSPLVASANQLRDSFEGFDMAMMRLKIGQMFGIKITREAAIDSGNNFGYSEPTTDSDGDGVADSNYNVKLDKGPFQLEMDAGEDAEFLESKTPATETVEFLKLMVHIAIKALDLPFSFFDESHTNFFGSRGALMHYLRSCAHKVADCQDLLNWITRWRLGMAIADGDLRLPRGVSFDTMQWEWVPDGVPWWDPSKEVNGNATAIAAGLDNWERVTRSTGTDVYENIEINARVMEFAKANGIELILPGTVTAKPEPEDKTDDNDELN